MRHQAPELVVKQTEVKKKEVKAMEQKANSFTVKVPEKAYVKGFSDGSFKPDQVVSRAEAAQILGQFIQADQAYRLAKDVDANAWYAKNMAKLYGLSIFSGTEDGSLRPQAGMSRAELSVLISRILKLKPDNARFNDVAPGVWYNGYVGAVQGAGIIQGYPDGSFGADRTVTRAELVVIVNRAFHVADKSGRIQFKDLPASHWAYKEIQKAAN